MNLKKSNSVKEVGVAVQRSTNTDNLKCILNRGHAKNDSSHCVHDKTSELLAGYFTLTNKLQNGTKERNPRIQQRTTCETLLRKPRIMLTLLHGYVTFVCSIGSQYVGTWCVFMLVCVVTLLWLRSGWCRCRIIWVRLCKRSCVGVIHLFVLPQTWLNKSWHVLKKKLWLLHSLTLPSPLRHSPDNNL